jgi:hypothetical protein
MKLFHERWRTAVSLLAAGALGDSDRAAALAHIETCGECRREHAQSVALLALIARDPVHTAEPGLDATFLVSRVEARLDAVVTSRGWRWGWATAGVALAAALVVLVPAVVSRILPAPKDPAAPAVAMDHEALRRLERNVAREQAVRYLNEAQDVLVTMAAHPRDCDRDKATVDVGDEARRSQDLLTRRTLLVEMDQEGLASARPVLEDVEHVLREVASFRSCARAGDVERVRRDLEERRLLMKIRLMSRELQG